MTRKEQYEAILNRAGMSAKDLQPLHISFVLLTEYLEGMRKVGIIKGDIGTSITGTGDRLKSICEEFEWKPLDLEIAIFAKGLIQGRELQNESIKLLKAYRDDRNKLIADYKNIGN